MEGVVNLHETLHELHKKKQSVVILKIDFENAYDKVKWSFVKQTLMMKGFSHTWLSGRGLHTKWPCWNQDKRSDRRKFYNKKRVEIGRPFIPHSFQHCDGYADNNHKKRKNRWTILRCYPSLGRRWLINPAIHNLEKAKNFKAPAMRF
jgi:hypothetical protein